MRELGRKTRLAAAMVALALAFAGCSGGGPKAVEVSSEADLSGLRVGCTAGSIYEMMLSQRTDAGVAEELRRLCREIVEEPTTRGFRVKFIL